MTYAEYYKSVIQDFNELKKEYPFSSICIPPTLNSSLIKIRVIAVNKEIIKYSAAEEKDFLGEYSKELVIRVPINYKLIGCEVYGGKWFCLDKIHEEDRHFYGRQDDGTFMFCVGVMKSFGEMRNVILENVKTADNMLTAYEQLHRGQRSRIKLIAYSHGLKGEQEYEKNRQRYRSD